MPALAHAGSRGEADRTRLPLRGRRHGPIQRDQDGYTLTEMLVVIAIIGLIAAVVIPQTIGQLGRAQSRAAGLQVHTIASALEIFQSDNGRFPTAQEGLQALLIRPQDLDSWNGPYLHDKDQLKDPWGHPYRYATNGSSVTVSTLGADNKQGGEGADRDVAATAP